MWESPPRTSWSIWGSLRGVSCSPGKTWPRFTYEIWRDRSLGWEWLLQRLPQNRGIGQIGVELTRFKLTHILWNEKVMFQWKRSGGFVCGICLLPQISLMAIWFTNVRECSQPLDKRALLRISGGCNSFIWYVPIVQIGQCTSHLLHPLYMRSFAHGSIN